MVGIAARLDNYQKEDLGRRGERWERWLGGGGEGEGNGKEMGRETYLPLAKSAMIESVKCMTVRRFCEIFSRELACKVRNGQWGV